MATLAKEQLQRFATDRQAQLRRIIDGAANTPETLAQLQEIEANIKDELYPAENFMHSLSTSIVRTVGTFAASEWRDLGKACFTLLEEEDVTATTSIFPDGSGLIIVSDALATLLYHLAALNVKLQPRRLGRRQMEPGTACAVIRFHLLQQRIYGLAAKCKVLLTEDEETEAQNLASSALHFVIAHEVAHYVLGHQIKPNTSATSARLPIADDQERVESEADAFAIKVQRSNIADPTGSQRPWLAMASGLLAVQAIELMERSLFVRRARSHPLPGIRWRDIRTGAPSADVEKAELYLLPILRTCDDARRVNHPLTQRHWQSLGSDPDILREHRSSEYLNLMAELDRFMGHDESKLELYLRRSSGETGIDLAPGLAQFPRGPRGVLEAWKVPKISIDAITDPNIALTFYSLHARIEDSPLLQRVTSASARMMVPLAAARVLESSLEKLNAA
jgi:hypothetical protein